MKPLPEKKESLWVLIVSPLVWAAHFLLCYLTAAIWCAKFAGGPAGSANPVRWAIVFYTVLALAGIAINARSGLRRHRHGAESVPHDWDTPEDRHRFLGYATLLLAGLSAVAVLFAASVTLFFGDCR
jgi:uncharacterized membrane protein YbhN (UPF0104 family)